MTEHQLKQFPFPVAYPAGQLGVATEPADQADKTEHLAEMVAVTLGVIAFGWCRARLFDPSGMRDWPSKAARNGRDLDAWIKVLRTTAKAMGDLPDDSVASAVRLASDAACLELTRYRTLRDLGILGVPNQLIEVADAIMDAVEPLALVRLGLVRRMTRRGPAYLTVLDVLAGPSAPFPSHSLSCQIPHDAGSVIVYHEGNPEFAVDLTPYCIWRHCPVCDHEAFYLHWSSKGTDSYVSFATGHRAVARAASAKPAKTPLARRVRQLATRLVR